MNFLKNKSSEHILKNAKNSKFKKVLTGYDLLLLCVGCTIASGIFVLTGISAAKFAGPSIALSFMISGFVCILTAFLYAELASIAPIAGSAYSYTYLALGRFPAWVVGWALMLEYTLCAATVAAGWSAYMSSILNSLGISLPLSLTKDAFSGGVINLPAVLISFLVMLLLIKGTKESSTFNKALVTVKLATIFLFVYIAAPKFDIKNWANFFPYGVGGTFMGAAFIFYAFVGFDSITTTAEECKNPQKDIVFGLVGGLIICIILYVLVAALLTGIVPYQTLNNAEPLAYALRMVGSNVGSALVATGAVAGITTSLLVMMYGQSRIFYAMSRDQLMPSFFTRIHNKFGTPHVSTIFTGIIVAILAGVFPIHIMGSLSSMGTLLAFTTVALGVMYLRVTAPEIERPFKCPQVYVIGLVSAFSSLYLIFKLLETAGKPFFIWITLGIIYYLLNHFYKKYRKIELILSESEIQAQIK